MLKHDASWPYHACFSTWTLYHTLHTMIRHCLAGLELELYLPHEYQYIFWLASPSFLFVFSSFHKLMQLHGVRRLSVCPSVCKLFCANRYFYHRSGCIATKLAHDGPHMGLHPGCAQGQGQGQRSRDTDTFLTTRKSLLLPQTWLDRDQTCTWWSPHGPASRVCSRSKVTWYGHFCNFTKIASSCRQIAGSRPNLHMMVRRTAHNPTSTMCSRSKVTWYGHFCDVTKCLL